MSLTTRKHLFPHRGVRGAAVAQSVFRRLSQLFRKRTTWVVGAVVLLYVSLISPRWHAYPDSATYLLLAQSINQGEGYAIHGAPHGKFPPGFAIYLAMMSRLGLGNMLALNTAMIAMGLGALVAVHGLLRELTTAPWATAGTLVVAFSYEMVRLSGAQLSDVPFLLLVSTGLWCLHLGLRRQQGWLELGTVLLIASCWIRVLGIPLALSAAIGLLLQARGTSCRRILSNSMMLITGALVTGLAFYFRDRAVQLAMVTDSYASELSVFSQGSPIYWIGRLLANWYDSGEPLAKFATGQTAPAFVAMIVFWLPILIGAGHAMKRRQYVTLFAAAGYLGSILILRVPLARYYLPIASILLLYLGNGVRIASFAVFRHAWRGPAVALSCSVLLVAANIPKDLRFVYRTHHPRHIQLSSTNDVCDTARFLNTISSPSGLFIAQSYASVLSYLSETPYDVAGARLLRSSRTPTQVIQKYLRQHDVPYVILRHTRRGDLPSPGDLERARMLGRLGFEQVFTRGRFRVYRREEACNAVLRQVRRRQRSDQVRTGNKTTSASTPTRGWPAHPAVLLQAARQDQTR